MMTTTGVMPPITRRPLYGSKVYVDADEVEGDERFSVVQFKFREIIRSELGEIGNFGFHRVTSEFYFCLSAGATGALGEMNSYSLEIGASEVNETGQNYCV